MLVSTFELLVKRQLPKSINQAGVDIILPTLPLSRPLVQGYFLTISNVTVKDAQLVLNFKSVTAVGISLPDITATIFDSVGVNSLGDLIPLVQNAYQYKLDIPAETTCLFILQPDIISNPNALIEQNIEIRGYLDVALDPDSPTDRVKFLITPEHRGTFYGAGITDQTPTSERQLGEIAYSLPTASGGSFFDLEK